MALITDPDQLIQGTEINLDVSVPATPTIELVIAGNLSEDGVEGRALYSFLKEEWVNEVNDMHLYDFPMQAITAEQFEIGNNGSVFSNWALLNDSTRSLIRTAGWREYDGTGDILREYLGVITLGNIDATSKTVGDSPYYAFSTDTASTSLTFAGPGNEGVQIFGNAANGNFDRRNDVLNVYIREQGKSYDQSSSTAIGLSSLNYNVARFPLQEGNDLDIIASDADVDTLAPYTGMSITYHQVAESRTVGASSLDFGITIEGNGGTNQEIYTFVQRQLRLLTDIDSEADAPTQVGNLQDALVQFVGQRLDTLSAANTDGGGTGVFIDNFDTNFTNLLTFQDNTGATVSFPFVSAGNLLFNTNLVNDTAAVYWLFFLDANGNEINTANGLVINDNSGNPISGTVSGNATISWDFDYDNNVQGGRTAGTPAAFVFRAMGLTTAQFAQASGTIERATGQNLNISAALERNYLNA